MHADVSGELSATQNMCMISYLDWPQRHGAGESIGSGGEMEYMQDPRNASSLVGAGALTSQGTCWSSLGSRWLFRAVEAGRE